MIWQVLSLLVVLMGVQGEVGHNETDESKSLQIALADGQRYL
jgi:hypothetical protein